MIEAGKLRRMAGGNKEAGCVPETSLVPELRAESICCARQFLPVAFQGRHADAIVRHRIGSCPALPQLGENGSQVEPVLSFVRVGAVQPSRRVQLTGDVLIELLNGEIEQL